MTPVTLPAAEQEMRIALAPAFTACWIRSACPSPSSGGGVSQLTCTSTWYCAESSFAAASAPVRAERNTGLVELFAIIAILRPGCFAAPVAAGCGDDEQALVVSATIRLSQVFFMCCIPFYALQVSSRA